MEDLKGLTTRELQSLLSKRGLSVSYRKKHELVSRLHSFLMQSAGRDNGKGFGGQSQEAGKEKSDYETGKDSQVSSESTSEEEVFEGTSKENTDTEQTGSNSGKLQTFQLKHEGEQIKSIMTEGNFVFKDVEESLETFTGESSKTFTSWIKDFDEIATVCKWNGVQKFLYARRLLRGAAKLAVEAEEGITSWEKLKSKLEEEFGTKLSSMAIHQMLNSRQKRVTETFLEYLFSMKQIANKGNVDEESLIAYIVQGVPGDPRDKTILYEAKSIIELKEKYKIYENIRGQIRQTKVRNEVSGESSTRSGIARFGGKKSEKRCGNCGAFAHSSTNCPDRQRGARCFACNEFGHIAPNCPKRKSSNGGQVNRISEEYATISVKLGDYTYQALIDTGSCVTLVKESILKRFGLQNYTFPGMLLRGFGSSKPLSTLGSNIITIVVQSIQFEILVHAVTDDLLSDNIILGKSFLDKAVVTIDGSKTIVRVRDSSEVNPDDPFESLDIVNLIEEEPDYLRNVENLSIRKEIEKLIQQYRPKKVEKSCIEMTITLEDEISVYQKARRLAPMERNFVNEQVKQWLEDGIIKNSQSNFASPVVLAKKKDGTYRLCIDFRKLNRKVVRDRYPLPIIEEVLEKLYEARVFTTLDLKNGFFHVDIAEKSRKYTSFITPDGQYEFLKAPFGLCNSPAVFQRFINTIFQELCVKGTVLLYMDDLVIPAKSEEENLDKFKCVLKVAEANGLIIKWEKCQFVRKSIEFLGHIIEDGSVKPSNEKIVATRNFPRPKSVKDVQSFLGLTGFFRKFIPSYSSIAKPLSDMLKKEKRFHFGPDEILAFEKLKECLCDEPVLKLFNPRLETELHADASGVGYGGVLLQLHEDGKHHPVFYLSFKATPSERNYSSYEHEILAVIKCLKKLRVYLLGLKFRIFTDCQAFQATMSKKDLCPRVARWAMLIQEFDCTVVHRSGSSMRHADCLSRYPPILKIEDGLLQRIRNAQQQDKYCNLITTILERNENYEGFTLRGGVLYKFVDGQYLLVVPRSLQREILKNIHNQGHCNARKMEAVARRDYFIPQMATKAENIIKNCVACILAARKEGRKEGFLNPIDKGDVPLYTLHLDHLGPLPSTAKSYKYLLVVVDGFSKFCWIYPVKSTTSEEVVKKLEFQSQTFGDPARVITDRGTAFTGGAFTEFCKARRIEHILITTGVPRGNGQVERMNRTIIDILAKLSVEDPMKWFKFVPKVQEALNSSVSRSTKRSPFELMFGIPMRKHEDLKLTEMIEEAIIDDFEDHRSDIRREAKEEIAKIQEENRRGYNKKRKLSRRYKVHDLVAILRTQFGSGLKLYPKYLGPYEVTKVKRNDRYEVQKVGEHQGPRVTHTAADFMKPWVEYEDNDESSSGPDDTQDGRL